MNEPEHLWSPGLSLRARWRVALQLVPSGNPCRGRRGGLLAVVCAGLLLLLMSKAGHAAWGIPLGMLFLTGTVWGILDGLGGFDDKAEGVSSHRPAAPLVGMLGALLLFAAMVKGASCGWGAQTAWGLGVTGAFGLLVWAVYAVGVQLGPWSGEGQEPRPLHKLHGFWLVLLAGALYFPTLGAYSLWDPWETHYGEVAREILARDDWTSLWWAQDGWFWSKPILNFWMQALSMGFFQVGYGPDQMLQGVGGRMAHPEWIVRTPNVLLTICCLYLFYKGASKAIGRRAAFLGSLALATMPDWYFLSHQTMADMPYVAPLTGAMGLFLAGLATDPEQKVSLYEVRCGTRRFSFSAWHLVFSAVIACSLPQILYLFSRHLTLSLHAPYGIWLHWDEFRSGSAGNCGLPGNAACRMQFPATLPSTLRHDPHTVGECLGRLFVGVEPILQALLWSGLLLGVLLLNRGERRTQRLYFLGAWFLTALATMGKGPIGFVLPLACLLVYVVLRKEWSVLLRLELPSALLFFLVIALPWFVAMCVRHGAPFVDRLIFHDMFRRAFEHVHDTNEGDDTSFRFYLWQLGYALFPWTGLAGAGLLFGVARNERAEARTQGASLLLTLWFLLAFCLFTLMGTKFHHYIFPAIPPLAMLIGLLLDTHLGTGGEPVSSLRTLWGFLLGRGERPPQEEPHDTVHTRLILAATSLAACLTVLLVGRDLIPSAHGGNPPGAIRLLQLFTYLYRRAWPSTLDFSFTLKLFTGVAALLLGLLCVAKLKRVAVLAFCILAFCWAGWGLNVYMTSVAPHWGQRELIEAYYQRRTSPNELLVAYQMNWKGENFYTGNRIPEFVWTGAKFTSWIQEQKKKGTRVLFLITEPSRVSSMRYEVGASKYEEITTPKLCNKFVVVRAEL